MNSKISTSLASLCLLLLSSTALFAQSAGPGLGNLSYSPSELFEPISIIISPEGHGNVAMVNGYLMVIYSSDGGGAPSNGGIEFWDVSDPRNPSRVIQHDNNDTHGLREAHGFGFSNSYPGDYLVAQAHDGIQFWDLTDPMNISLLDYMDLPNISQGDYSGAWSVFWQAPYVYVAGQGSGLYVVDASDPTAPVLAKRMQTGELGGVNPGVVYALGNLLVVAESRDGNFATLDISDPVDPVLIQTFNGDNGYSHVFAAGMLLTSGGNGAPTKLHVHHISHSGVITSGGDAGSGLGNGGYGSYQDGFFHSGFSSKYAKIHIGNLNQIGDGTSGISGRDEDFGLVLGNVVFVGSDHRGGSALIVHQTAPDTTGPDVHWVHPADGATGQALTSRVGVSMSDNIDLDSIDDTTFIVRPFGGAALPGKYSVQMGLVNFSPDQPLANDTTYEVILSGLTDLVGNTGAQHVSTFSTGAANPDTVPPQCVASSNGPAVVDTIVEVDIDNSIGPILTYSWDFGDGSTPTPPSANSSASHAYTAPGRYPVILTVTNAFVDSTCSFVQIVHQLLSAVAPVHSSPIISAGGWVYNVNPDNDTVTAIDASSLAKLWEIPVGAKPQTLATVANGDLWVVNQDDATISVLDPNDGSLITTHPLPHFSRPYGIAYNSIADMVYVSLQGRGELLALDWTGSIVATLPIGAQPRGIAVGGVGSRILVTQFVSTDEVGRVHEVAAASFTVTRTFELAFDPGPDAEDSGRGVPNYISSVAISPDDRTALVPSKKDNVARGVFRDGEMLNFESMVRAIVSRLDLLSNVEDLDGRIDLNDRNMPQAVRFSPAGDIYFVATQGTNLVEFFDATDGALLGALGTGLSPQGMVLNDDASRLFVHNYMSRSVSAFDVSDIINAMGNAGSLLAEISTVSVEALPAQVLQGKQIFYNASDPRMSQDMYMSCASCHLDGGSDGQVWDFTQVGEGFRNTISLRGRAGLGHGLVHWTANFDEIQDFEHDIRHFAGGNGFMSQSDFDATNTPLGAPKAGLSPELDALAAYVSSLDAVPPSPYRTAGGGLTPDGELGAAIFSDQGCDSCHTGSTFTDEIRRNVGTIQISSGDGHGELLDLDGFETPTLLGIWNTAPYLHDGRAATLYDMLDNLRLDNPLLDTTAPFADAHDVSALTSSEKDQLVAYLSQIDRTPPDTDGDGFHDGIDAFPSDPSEWADTDGDGVGDNVDAFPNDPNETADSDGDGVGDNADVFPNDPNESIDSDGDGVGNNGDAFPNDPNETADSDSDGVGDSADVFPNDPNETADSDGDGVGDNADAFPNDADDGNDSPAALVLASPADGATNLDTTVTFVWKVTTDPDGDPLNYRISICENDPSASCPSTLVAAAEKVIDFANIENLVSLVLFGTVLGGIGLRRRKWLVITLTGFAIIGLLSNCGGGGGSSGDGGGGGPPPVAEMDHTEAGLKPATTYYWKVSASDGIDTVESATQSFTTL